MKEVILNGFLGEKYGTKWRMEANSYAEIFSCIDANYPGFKKDLIDLAEAGGDLSIEVAGNLIEDAEELLGPLTAETIIITPVPTGSKSGTVKLIVGTILLIAGFYLAPMWLPAGIDALASTFLISMGANLAIMGLQQMLAPDPSVDDDNRDYLFEGPENTTVSGNPVPVLCGEMIIGGTVISAGTVGGNHISEATFVSSVPLDGSWNGGNQASGSISGNIDTYYPGEPTNEDLQRTLLYTMLGIRAVGS